MTVRIEAIDESGQGPIHIVVAGYRARPCENLVRAAKLSGSTYRVRWAAGSWAEAGASAGVMARATRVAVPALHQGRALVGVGSLAGGIGAAAVIGAANFRIRYATARRDGLRLADEIMKLPGVRTRPLNLIGHSLGTVVVRAALERLSERPCHIEDVLLMGGMTSRKKWDQHAEMFRGRLVNLYSPWDRVLNVAPVLDRVVGTGAILCDRLADRLTNHDLCRELPHQLNFWKHHSGYWNSFGRFAIPV
ncbi:DUF726 domain-containing protein [Rhodopirellula halodulae]|uniref:DUF726 domain-containing protein n=1 Tax=Rhodopirellula halodulae TaxID=2894198 RepID=UPI001E5CD5E9|nr:DUF726 domain-containing protein [Rhodopirellula sp. JC737]MCC9655650.1 DUF726 domain-containing protein [Rhodopirellula sp. JC737]